jgi:putative resolvase
MIAAVKLSEWAKVNGVSHQSACRWSHAGVLPVPAHQFATGTALAEEPPAGRPGLPLYAMVPPGDQRSDLDRQVARLTMQATADGLASTKVVAEVGSAPFGHRTSCSVC